jgi:hypothetical protein
MYRYKQSGQEGKQNSDSCKKPVKAQVISRRLQDKKNGQHIVAAKKDLVENRSCDMNIPKPNELAEI